MFTVFVILLLAATALRNAEEFAAEKVLLNKYDDLSAVGIDRLLDDTHSEGNAHCGNAAVTINSSCIVGRCLSGSQLLSLSGFGNNGIDIYELRNLSSVLLLQTTKKCSEIEDEDDKPSKAKAWGYGLLAVSIINITSVLGFFFKPCMGTFIYKRIMMYMVSLAVGTLSGSAMVFLIPESFKFADSDEYSDIYAWRLIMVCVGIYMFFLTERILTMMMKAMDKNNTPLPNTTMPPSITLHTETKQDHMITPFETPVTQRSESQVELTEKNGHLEQSHGHSHGQSIKTVAWMIIIGDALHNFMDGMALGAAFNLEITGGVSLSLAVFCEELPHELGDFAVLLNSGMTMKQAICFNFLSACTCYAGFVVGVIIGEMGDGASWIFVLTAGMFLYISLVDMLPEVNAVAEEEVENGGNPWSIFLVQNLGLLTGWGIMLLLAKIGHVFEF